MLDFGDRTFILGDLFGVAAKFSQFAQLQDGDASGSRSTGDVPKLHGSQELAVPITPNHGRCGRFQFSPLQLAECAVGNTAIRHPPKVAKSLIATRFTGTLAASRGGFRGLTRASAM